MALTIEHPEVDRLARELAATTGESPTEVVLQALRERLIREQGRKRMFSFLALARRTAGNPRTLCEDAGPRHAEPRGDSGVR